MLSGTTPSACAMVGTAVFRIVVSSASLKKATATSHGTSLLLVPLRKTAGFGLAGAWGGESVMCRQTGNVSSGGLGCAVSCGFEFVQVFFRPFADGFQRFDE